MSQTSQNPFLLAANTPDPDPRLLPLLRSKPELASRQDAHGYSLLHAAASYNHVELLRSLILEFKVDVNLKDEDGETCLFVAETLEVVTCLVEDLHIDPQLRNDEDQTALEKFEAEEEFPQIVDYLRSWAANVTTGTASTNGEIHASATAHSSALPANISFNVDTESRIPDDLSQEPDPDFKRRIEELASNENFHTPEGQQELRDLITDAVRDVGGDGRDVRRRVG